VKQHLRVVLVFVAAAFVAVAVASIQAQGQPEPLWAYAYSEQPKAGDKAAPQPPPNRNLRPNEDQAEQTKARTVPGGGASCPLVDVRDGHEVRN